MSTFMSRVPAAARGRQSLPPPRGAALPIGCQVAPGPRLAIGECSHAPPRGSSVVAMDDASLRVCDADREQAVVALREHLLAGRLTLEEFSKRVEAALRARFGGELARVQDDPARGIR